MAYMYIFISASRKKYYVGSTRDELTERLRRHNTNHDGFTGSTNDWVVVYHEVYENYADALKREKEIKRKKSRKFIEDLIKKV